MTVFFILLFNINFALLIPKLSGIELDFYIERLALYALLFFLFVCRFVKDIKITVRLPKYLLFNNILLFYIIFSILFIGRQDQNFNYLELSNFIFFIIFYFILKNIKNINIITYVNNFLLLLYCFSFAILQLLMGMTNGLFVNTIYYQLSLIPFLLLLSYKHTYISLFLLSFITLNSVISGKRSLLIFCLMSFIFILIKRLISRPSDLYKILFVIFPFIIIISYINFDNTSISRFTEIGFEDDSRLYLLTTYFSNIYSFSFLEMIYGHGISNSTKDILVSNSVHNDFLEVHYRLGLVGLFFYICIFINIYKAGLIFIYDKYILSVFRFSFLLFFLFSFMSMLVFIPSYYNFFVIFWFAVIAHQKNTKRLLN